MQSIRIVFAITAIASLSACLDNDLERGLAGAAAGAIVADATGVSPLTGAVAGGAAGALCDEVFAACR